MDDGKRMAAASACRGWPVRRTWSPPGIQSIPQHHGVGRRELREPGVSLFTVLVTAAATASTVT